MTRMQRLLDSYALVRAPFDVNTLPGGERLDAWRAVVCKELVQVRVEFHEAHRGPFHAKMQLHALGAVRMAELESASLRVHRDADAISENPSEFFLLILQLSGDGCEIRQAGAWQPLADGSIALVDPSRPFTLSLPARFQHVVIRVPRETVASRVRDGGRLGGAVLAADHPLARLAVSTIRDVLALDPVMREDVAAGLGYAIAELLAVAVAVAASRPAHAPGTRWNEARTHAELRLADPELSPTAIANALGISVRYVHQIFAEQGTTVGRYVRERRIERCAADLLAVPARKVSDVALAWGFNDPAYFSRCFRENVGISPSEWRQGSAAREASVGLTPAGASALGRPNLAVNPGHDCSRANHV
jgi:AraC-like DNA-binding protein